MKGVQNIKSMKKIFLSLALTTLCCSLFSQLSCDQTLWPHVYNPQLFQGEKKCLTIKGIVKEVKEENDGGYRIRIKLDPGQPTTLLNDKNISLQNSCIVVAIICAHRPITQADALKSCGTYESKIKVPKVGDHLQVTGTYVLDTEQNHGWYELHPVSEIIELQKR
jgi:hypothetical protein